MKMIARPLILAVGLVLLLPNLAGAQGKFSTEVLPDRSGLRVRTPSMTGRETMKLRLTNGLEAYLISDPGADQSSAALRVDVGSYQDPDSRPGMAHFIEHMLFLGTETYPEEGGFRKFVEDHGGRANAGTADTYTMYMFSVNTGAFPEALDRFAHFFVDPLFTSSAIGREQHAIDQEFERAVEDDDWRQLMVQKEIANPKHPFSRFGAGNSKTLEGISSEEARSWYNAHYSANLMHLVVYSSLPIKDLQAMVVQDFRQIPNSNIHPYAVTPPKTTAAQKGKAVYITPHKSLRNVTLVWELPYDYQVDRETHAADLIAHVLGHEGPGSLLAQLKREGLAEGIQSAVVRHKRPHAAYFDLYVSMDLTAKGLKERKTAVQRVFQTIQRLREEGIPEYLHDERATLKARKYEYQTRDDAYETVSQTIRQMGSEELQTFPRLTLLPSRYDTQAIQDILEQLTPANMQLLVTGRPSETRVKPSKSERWMEANYEVRDFQGDEYQAWNDPELHPSIKVPPLNPYTPTELSVAYHGPCERCMATPELLVDDAGLKLYYAQDQHYLVPEVAWILTIKSEAVRSGNAEEAVLNELLVRSASEALAPEGYLAAMAGLEYSLEPVERGVRIQISGYSDKASLLLEKILATLYSEVPTEEQFGIFKESLLSDYNNATKRPPVEQALEVVSRVLRRDHVTDSEHARALRRVDYDRLTRFCKDFPRETYREAVLFGNLSEPVAREVGELIVEAFPSSASACCRTWKPAIAKLPDDGGPFYLEKKTRARGNAIVLTVQEGPFTFKRRAAQQILALGIETPFFVTLRTEQQTGYLVHSWDQEVERQLFGFFAVQSNSHQPRDLLARFELMIETFLRDLRSSELPEQRFEEMKLALVTRLTEPPRNPMEMAQILAELAFKYDGNFGWLEERIKGVKSLSYDEFEVLAREYLGKGNKQRLAVLVEGKVPPVTTLQYRKVRSPIRMKQLADFVSRDAKPELP